jgi:inorganic pyrophosphatase
VDKDNGALFVDRFMMTAMHYPCNCGYIPRTLFDDGDPVDEMVISPVPVTVGAVIRCRPIGILRTTRPGATPSCWRYRFTRSCRSTSTGTSPGTCSPNPCCRSSTSYGTTKDLEPGKGAKVVGWGGPAEARGEIMAGVARYQQARPQPKF